MEPAGHGIESGEHGAPLKHGRVGIYFGMKSPMMQTAAQLPQKMRSNMYHYRVFNGISVLVPHFRIDLLGRKYPACVFHKKLKNFKLRGGELDRFSVNL